MSTEIKATKVAVVGCGYWGKNLVRNFADLGALGAIVDSQPHVAAEMAAKFGVPARDWAAVLSDRTIAGVIVATPAETHYRLAREGLAAGKHVFVEKPLALELTEAESLCAFAADSGQVLMVGHLLQYHPAFVKLKELVNRGDLGRVQYIYSNRLNLGKIRREENILWSFAPHDISMILGLIASPLEEVTAVGSTFLHRVIADVTTTHLSFAGNEHAHIFVSWLHPYKEQKLVVVGDAGMCVFDDGKDWPNKVEIYRHRIEWVNGQPVPARAQPESVPIAGSEPLRLECQHFLDCITLGLAPRTDGAEALRVLRTLHASERSMRESRPVRMSSLSSNSPAKAEARFPGAMIHDSAFIDQDVSIGEGTKIWHVSHVLANVKVGCNCMIGQNVVIGPDVTVGNRCKIQNNVSIYKGVTLEDGVFCGPSCVFTNVNNPRAEIERKNEYRPTLVRHGATIGANATIVCGVTLGKYSFIAAGAVVIRDVPAYALMAGVPAQRIGWMSKAGGRLGQNLVCPLTGQRYRQLDTNLIEETPE
jgi:predicted dehydrogenase/acetyltransferase-like isoleucine patch superfamily enzyme